MTRTPAPRTSRGTRTRTSKTPSQAFPVSPLTSMSGAPIAERPSTVVLLGAQRFQPTLGAVVSELGIRGRIALITAGWQEREVEDDELSQHLGGNTVNLRLHGRMNELFARDTELAAAHRERQQMLRHLQEIYRIRLEHAFEAERDVHAYDVPTAIRDEVWAASLEAIRSLDTWHLGHCSSVRADFNHKLRPLERDAVVKHRDELRAILADCSAIAIAGGHVAVLLNRLDTFGVDELLGTLPVFAWSAGAMAVTDRIVLFHDDPPEGRPARQVLDEGLRLVPQTVVLPNPERRLGLRDKDQTAHLPRRFSPSTCLVFPARSYAVWRDGHFVEARGVAELNKDGTFRRYRPAGAQGSGSLPDGAPVGEPASSGSSASSSEKA